MEPGHRLLNFGFITLNVLVLFAFCNLAVFYSFYNYLATLPIPEHYRGMLIGLLPASALIFRPIISPFLGPQNAIKGIGLGLFMIVISLCLYASATSLVFMVLLRIFHGAAYVTLMSSSVTLLMVFMPPRNSGQGFGIISIMTLLPYAIVPLFLESGFAPVIQHRVYSYTALLMLPCALLLIPLSKKLSRQDAGKESFVPEKLPEGSLWANIRQPKICLLLLSNGLVFSVYALIFFFLKTFVLELEFGDVGLFFTLSTIVMILVRFFFGALFDIYDKGVMGILSLGVFATGLGLLGFVDSAVPFYGIAILYGMGMGAASPLLNGLMFMVSEPRYRGLNTNLMLEMVDAGFFLGPLVGGLAVTNGFGPSTILVWCAGITLLTSLLLLPFIGKTSNPK